MKRSENFKEIRAKYDFFDGITFIAILALSALGVLMVFSITGTSIFNNREGNRLSYMMHSATGVLLGFLAMSIMTIVPNRLFRGRLGALILLVTTIILVITPIFGQDVPSSPGVYRWLTIPGIITFQAVDLARIGFTLSLPWIIQWLVSRRLYYSKKLLSYWLIPLGYVGLCTLLILQQPDLGSAIIIFFTGIIVFLSSGIGMKQSLVLLLPATIILVFAVILGVYFFDLFLELLPVYQMDRIQVWLDPFSHDFGRQSVMGFVSIALGGWTGVGLGKSTQALGFAIEPHTDLIVTILAEELGLIAVIIVMMLYFLVAIRCFLVALKARDVYSALVCIGIGAFFLTQPLVNLAGASGLIPLSGVTLPLISYGMTSKVSTFVLIGIYFNMRRHILIDVEKNEQSKKRALAE